MTAANLLPSLRIACSIARIAVPPYSGTFWIGYAAAGIALCVNALEEGILLLRSEKPDPDRKGLIR